MRNTGLDEAQAGIKIARRNNNNLRYADDTTLMAENEGELKILLMKVKEDSEKVGLSSTFRKRRSWHLVPFFLGSKITADGDCSHEIKTLTPWKERYDQPR